jgi:hypothetical protein
MLIFAGRRDQRSIPFAESVTLTVISARSDYDLIVGSCTFPAERVSHGR